MYICMHVNIHLYNYIHIYTYTSLVYISNLSKVLDYEPESVEALVAKAKSLKAGGSKVEALATLRHAQLCQPNNKEINRAIHRSATKLIDKYSESYYETNWTNFNCGYCENKESATLDFDNYNLID